MPQIFKLPIAQAIKKAEKLHRNIINPWDNKTGLLSSNKQLPQGMAFTNIFYAHPDWNRGLKDEIRLKNPAGPDFVFRVPKECPCEKNILLLSMLDFSGKEPAMDVFFKGSCVFTLNDGFSIVQPKGSTWEDRMPVRANAFGEKLLLWLGPFASFGLLQCNLRLEKEGEWIPLNALSSLDLPRVFLL